MPCYFLNNSQQLLLRRSADKKNKVKYRSRVSSFSFDNEKSIYTDDLRKKWIHIRTNIRRNQPVDKKFELTSIAVFNKESKGVHSLDLSPKNEVALGFGDGSIRIKKLIQTSNIEFHELRPPTKYLKKDVISARVTSLRFVPLLEHLLIATNCSGEIQMFNLNSNYGETVAKEESEINAVDVNYSGSKFVTGGKDAILRVYDGERGQIILKTPSFSQKRYSSGIENRHHLRINCVKFDPENYNYIFSGGLDGFVKMWDIRDKFNSVRTFRGPYIRGEALDLYHYTLLTGSWCATKSIQLWDIGTGKPMHTIVPTNRAFSQDGEFVTCAKFFNGYPQGSIILVGGDGTGEMEIISMKFNKIIGRFKAKHSITCIGSTFGQIVFGGLDNQCQFVHYTDEDVFLELEDGK